MFNQPMLACDFYKISHREQYPKGTETVYSTWTPRISRMPGVTHVVAFGFQKFVQQYLFNYFNANFFERPLEEVLRHYKRTIKNTLGIAHPETKHIEDLHALGFLPLSIKALPEGTKVPLRVPMLTIENTHPDFFWLTNYIETLASCELWKATNSATIAWEYRKLFNRFAKETGCDTSLCDFQGHDFSFRGMSGMDDAITSGMAHLLSFIGTDTIPAILAHELIYDADISKELVGCSIPATEHSVMCANGQDELASYKRLITEVYPKGFVSIVSDTWDFWNVIDNVIAPLKDVILARDGRVVIRPDSGDPVEIMTKLIPKLWDIFGGTINEKGFKVLDSHIGAIYGEAINLERAEKILQGLKYQGFASTNAIFGIGSFTYQFNTRDTLGLAYKSTSCMINGVEHALFKSPKTDDGSKWSQKGRVHVYRNKDGELYYADDSQNQCDESVAIEQMREIFRDGKMYNRESLSEIRKRVQQ